MHLNATTDANIFSTDNTSIECVQDFKYLGSYTDTDHDMEMRIKQAWGALNSLSRIWKSPLMKSTKTKVFKACVETILLYGSESWSLNQRRKSRLDGTYTKMLRVVYGISWRLYGPLPPISEVVHRRFLALAGHVTRGSEPAGELIFWQPEEKKRIGRPRVTLKNIIETETDLQDKELRAVMLDRNIWRKTSCTLH